MHGSLGGDDALPVEQRREVGVEVELDDGILLLLGRVVVRSAADAVGRAEGYVSLCVCVLPLTAPGETYTWTLVAFMLAVGVRSAKISVRATRPPRKKRTLVKKPKVFCIRTSELYMTAVRGGSPQVRGGGIVWSTQQVEKGRTAVLASLGTAMSLSWTLVVVYVANCPRRRWFRGALASRGVVRSHVVGTPLAKFSLAAAPAGEVVQASQAFELRTLSMPPPSLNRSTSRLINKSIPQIALSAWRSTSDHIFGAFVRHRVTSILWAKPCPPYPA